MARQTIKVANVAGATTKNKNSNRCFEEGEMVRIGIITLLLFFAQPIQASPWFAEIEEDDFGDQDTGIALTERNGRAFGIRCERKKVPSLIFATREKWATGLSLLDAKLLVRVDKNDVVERMAHLEPYSATAGFAQFEAVRAIASGDDLFPLLNEIAKANSRVSVAIEIAGQRFENTRFSVSGSSRAIKKVWPNCGSELGDYEKPEL